MAPAECSAPIRTNVAGSIATAVMHETPAAPDGITGHVGPAGARLGVSNGQWFMPSAIAPVHRVGVELVPEETGWYAATCTAGADNIDSCTGDG